MEIVISVLVLYVIVLSVIVGKLTATAKRQGELMKSLVQSAVKSAEIFKLLAQAVEQKKK